MTDAQTTLRELKDLVLSFSRERDWEKFHHPKDLGVALRLCLHEPRPMGVTPFAEAGEDAEPGDPRLAADVSHGSWLRAET